MTCALDRDTHLAMYRKVSLIKANDDRIQAEIMAGRLVMPYYSTRGQEVIPAAMSMHLNPEDYIVTIYRGIHDSVAKGIPLPDLWAELAGRGNGHLQGQGWADAYHPSGFGRDGNNRYRRFEYSDWCRAGVVFPVQERWQGNSGQLW